MEILFKGFVFVAIVNFVWIVMGLIGLLYVPVIGYIMLIIVMLVHSAFAYLSFKAMKEIYGD